MLQAPKSFRNGGAIVSSPKIGLPHYLQKVVNLMKDPDAGAPVSQEDYLTNFNSYLETIRSGCIGSNVDYTLVDTSRPLDAVLGEFMDRRASAFSGNSAGARQ